MTASLAALALFLGLFAAWRFLFFFRNPRRAVVADERAILSPADGFVVYARRVRRGEPVFSVKQGRPILLDDLMLLDDPALPRDGWLVGVFMSPFDVHYNRAPIRGRIRKVAQRFPGDPPLNATMFPAQSNLFFDLQPYTDGCDYLAQNERASFVVTNERRSLYVTQIADRWVRRIVTFKDGVDVAQGEVFGLIRMGSQVDVFVPDPAGALRLAVAERQRVKAGLTVLLREEAAT